MTNEKLILQFAAILDRKVKSLDKKEVIEISRILLWTVYIAAIYQSQSKS